MAENHQQLWAKCLDFIKDNVQPDQFDKWFSGITSLGFDNNELHLHVPSDAVVEFIENRYLRLLGVAILKVYGQGVKLRYSYVVRANDPESAVSIASTPQSTEVLRQTLNSQPADPLTMDTSRLKPFNPQLNPKYTFENYCVSDSNRLPYSIAMSIAENPKVKTFNPFFLFGSTGVGKTHLIQAIGIRIKERNPQARVFYVSTRLFESQYTMANSKGQINKFFAFYQSIETLIVDDVQDLAGKPGTQNTFFNIFNHLHLNGRQIILSSDRAPAEMDGLEGRLLGRFKWGMVTELEKPDEELRRAVLKLKSSQDGILLPDDVVDYVVENVTDSIRELEGVLVSMTTQSAIMNVPIDMAVARTAVSNLVKLKRHKINFEMITQAVSEYYSLQPDVLFTKSRKREISDARQVVMYMAKKHAAMATTAIGHRLGRTHATVIHGVNNIEQRLEVDRLLQADIAGIEERLPQMYRR